MKPIDEYRLYLRDKRAWAKHVAPKWIKTLEASDESERRRLWRIAGPELRDEIRRLRQSHTSSAS